MESPTRHSTDCPWEDPLLSALGVVKSAHCPFCQHTRVLVRGFYCACGFSRTLGGCQCRGMVVICCETAAEEYRERRREEVSRESARVEDDIRRRIHYLVNAA